MLDIHHLRWASAALALLSAHCAPLGMLRPPVPFPDNRRNEIGLGSVMVSPRPYVVEPWTQAGQMWITRQALPWLQLSAISAFDPRALALGLGARALWLRSSRLGAGFDVELGYGWGALGLPLGVRLFGRSWLYASPRVGNYGIEPSFGLPIGLSLNVQRGAFLRLEYQTSWVNLLNYQQRNHFGAALAVDW